MILTDREIENLVQEKNIIENYNGENLQAVSYDLTSSNIIQVYNKIQSSIDLKSPDSIKAATQEIVIDYGYRLMPHEFILIKTKEKINMPDDMAAHVRPRTTYNKLGLILSDQHINPSFSGYLYLGLFNATPNIVTVLPNLIIGQLIFEKTSGNITPERLYKNKTNAKYQNESSFIHPDLTGEMNSQTKAAYLKLSNDMFKNAEEEQN